MSGVSIEVIETSTGSVAIVHYEPGHDTVRIGTLRKELADALGMPVLLSPFGIPMHMRSAEAFEEGLRLDS